MSLDRFREAAEEKTAHLRMTPELQARILASLHEKKPVRYRFAVVSAAACLMVMALSAGILAMGNGGRLPWQQPSLPSIVEAPSQESPQPSAGTHLAQDALLSEKYGLQLVSGDSGEMYTLAKWERTEDTIITPKEGDDGLWGYVDENGDWLVEPMFLEAHPVSGISARVVDQDGNVRLFLFN